MENKTPNGLTVNIYFNNKCLEKTLFISKIVKTLY